MWLLRPLPLLAVVVVACLGVAGVVTAMTGDTGDDPSGRTTLSPAPTRADDPAARALDVLAAWDRSRAAAYSAGDVAALHALYVPGAPAGRRDVAVLRRYAARGLEVRGLGLQRSAAEVVVATDRRLAVEVVERLAAGRVVSGGAEVALPADRPERRVVRLVRGARGWQVAAVEPVAAATGAARRPGGR
jgi:hypothetical protein